MVDYIHIGGQLRPIRYTVGAYREFLSVTGRNLGNLQTDNIGFDDADIQIYAALKHGAKSVGEKFKETPEKVKEWIEDLDMKDYIYAMNKINAMVTGELTDGGADQPETPGN